MIEKIRQSPLTPVLLRRRTFSAALIASLMAILYWGVIASDRYVSEAHVVVQNADLAAAKTADLSTLLGGIGGTNGTDQHLLRDYLLSVDMLLKLQERLDLRAHYSDSDRDLLSRMWGKDTELEWFHRHYLSRVSVEYDERAGVLIIKVQAYSPEMAHSIAGALVEEGERFMNQMAHRLAQEQVTFLEQQLVKMNARTLQARQAVLDFQNANELVSPEGTVQSLAAVINELQASLVEMRARRGAMLGYLMDDSPDIVELDLQIAAIENQIEHERRRLTSPAGKALNRTVEEYQRLQMEAEFAQEVYKTALVALEQGRIEATRTLKKVSVLQQPTYPQYPLEPRRTYNIVVFMLVALLIAGIVHLMAAIIRDHKD